MLRFKTQFCRHCSVRPFGDIFSSLCVEFDNRYEVSRGKMGMLTILILIVMKGSDGLTWNTKMMAYVCCEGNNQFLIWNFTEGENERVTELHWFFNKRTLVCFVSTSTGFRVAVSYKGRVERNGTAGILLKNVSLNDTGDYTLYVKLEEEKEPNVQGINLTVVAPPPNQCKPKIKKEHPKGIISCSTSCERSGLSIEWIINGTKDTGDIGPYFVVNSWGTSEQPICCLRDFKCLDDYQTKFCTPNHFSFTEDMHTVNESVADTNHMVITTILITLVLIMIQMVLIIVVILNRRRCRLYPTMCRDTNKSIPSSSVSIQEENFRMLPTDQEPHAGVDSFQVPEETVPMLPNDQDPHADVNVQVPETPSPVLRTFQELDADVKLDQIQVAVEPTHSNAVVQGNEDLQQVPTVAATTDWPLQDSIQNVNNISIVIDFLKRMCHSNTALMTELQASRKETRKLKRQLHREKHLRKKENRPKYSFEMTPLKYRYFKKNDTDSWKTSESEDASSETRKLKMQLHREKHLRPRNSF